MMQFCQKFCPLTQQLISCLRLSRMEFFSGRQPNFCLCFRVVRTEVAVSAI
jgi:hypothetical protein